MTSKGTKAKLRAARRGRRRLGRMLIERRERVAELEAENERLRAAAWEMHHLALTLLGKYYERGHPGVASIRTGWVGQRTFSRWRATVERVRERLRA